MGGMEFPFFKRVRRVPCVFETVSEDGSEHATSLEHHLLVDLLSYGTPGCRSVASSLGKL